MRALSIDLHERIVAAYDGGGQTQKEVAQRFCVSEFTVKKLLRQRRRGYLPPPYSPDLNPIEMMWSKVKPILRKLEHRDTESLLAAIGFALFKVTAGDAIGWLSHCGYNFIENSLGDTVLPIEDAHLSVPHQ